MTIEPTTIILAALATLTIYNSYRVWLLGEALDEVDEILVELIESHNSLVQALQEVSDEQD